MSSLIRHVTPIPQERAKGLLAQVYTQVDAEFSSIGPAVAMMSPAPELMAAGWSLMRESQLAGEASAVDKTLVALGAARANGLDYDVEAFLAVLRLLGEAELAEAAGRGEPPADPDRAALLEWAASTGLAAREPLEAPFAGARAAEFLGTLLFTHFIDRVAAAMLPAGLTPGTLDPADLPPFEGAPVLRGPGQDLRPGTTLPLLDGLPAQEPPAWADGLPIGRAYAALAATAAQGAGLLTPAAAETVSRVIAEHRGRRLPETGPLEEPLAALPEEERAGARVAILAGLAPEAVTDEQVADWRATDRRLSDHCTVYLLAHGAMTAVTHIEADLTRTAPGGR
ncbi:DNA-binding protein [Nonomuraea sp. WAC 01424]|uniref:DNA-binding protein n=1 Tax=Nonomuraea sp. WAC 01424 TaxID=2203200 RepID=UPI000F78FF84|nr:DNA-binding protein [Nonomuraea sp. WAC 01424]RSM97090.1 DNA-binding protein [Nonomuraea sp. WAC 01424]